MDHYHHHESSDHRKSEIMEVNHPMGHQMDHMDMMKMYFHFDLGDILLFKNWKLESTGSMVIACVIFFLIAFFYEGLKSYREFLYRRYMRQRSYQVSVITPRDGCPERCSGDPNNFPSTTVPEAIITCRMWSMPHISQSLLHVLQVTTSYVLMLGFMTFNVWICLAIVLGAGHGYFAFCWRRLTIIDTTEHCN
ncbi:high affinity copper uptake protein 1-like isoform X1 [Brevipalpus obovatus]|uniref:high affinity copper uptake protein 1-like isoform X1 n=1 Tax=Brevipalpus obovatus TaxID=246614 RepID=UPI003D9E2400